MARLSVVYHMARLSVGYHMARLSVVVLMVEGLQIVFPSRGVSRFELVVLSHYPKDSCMYVCVCLCACVRVWQPRVPGRNRIRVTYLVMVSL